MLTLLVAPVVGWFAGGAWEALAGSEEDGEGGSWAWALFGVAVVVAVAWAVVEMTRAGALKKGSVGYAVVEGFRSMFSDLLGYVERLGNAVLGPVLRFAGVV